LEQIERLRSRGVDLRHVCLSHTDRKPDPGYHREILATGVRVEYDSAFRWPQHAAQNPARDLLVALLPEFPDQIMLGMDAARRSYWRSYNGSPGLSFLLTTFTAQLHEAGVSTDALHRVFVTTPAATFSFASPQT
jgi:5-phospho-D-xylono-1,4-lactonase